MGIELIIFFLFLALGIYLFVGFLAKRNANNPDLNKSSKDLGKKKNKFR
jgi:hypothetical protein